MKILFLILSAHLWVLNIPEKWGNVIFFLEITDTTSISTIDQDVVRGYLDDGYQMISMAETTADTLVFRDPAITVPEILLSTGIEVDTNNVFDSLSHIILLNKFMPMNIRLLKEEP
jgi:hypothetical protein